ncbi:lipoate--protein ligase family protein [Nocardioides sp. JQ2195]|uniref:lipoate--protein ligase family protein n=1 Tax=Nocardioides sp. JQ2195 TaxID=2592334 RepID=UPI00143E96C8|nr:lipoate--protein ligase family protein [Nocardioides sp. JQ2195]QIX28163.1 lipoate--protein ligase family protein [Nocardioides sp. JQ2195]
MDLLRGRVADDDPALEMAASHALLRQASRGEIGAALRVFRPTRMVAFGRRDTNRPGFQDAARACREAGFTPVVRASGGRAVACTPAALVVDHVQRDPASLGGMDARFEDYGAMLAGVLADFGIDARVGEVPGEYCPGAHSINARGTVKLIGTAQRMVRDAWLFSSIVQLDDASVLRPLLAEVYTALEVEFDPASVGAFVEEAPGVPLDTLEQAVIGAYDDRFGLVASTIAATVLDQADAMVADHRVTDDNN